LISRIREHVPLLVIALVVLTVDQLSKWWVITHMQLGESWSPAAFLRPIAALTYVTNTGVAFGLFPGGGNIFVGVAMLAIVAIVAFYAHLAVGRRLMQLALGLTVGGAIGNLLDRLIHGHVIDFIDLRVWPVFNLADSSIVVAMLILAYYLLWQERRQPEPG
jgi:signal peptidase II